MIRFFAHVFLGLLVIGALSTLSYSGLLFGVTVYALMRVRK